jgi:hypothetical protein
VDGRLLRIGQVDANWPETVDLWLRRRVAELRLAEPPCDPAADDIEVAWLRPHLTATVHHGGRARDGSLRFPMVVALREDLDPAACARRDPVPPPHDRPRPGGFRPTVLSTLPFTDPRPH